MLHRTVIVLAAAVAAAGFAGDVSSMKAAPENHRTDWFQQAQWGVFTHYLTGPETTAEEWNRQVDAFDVPGLAAQLQAAGAKYYVITLGQNSGHYCAANAAYDRIAGISPGKCSRRDLVADLRAALAPMGIRLMLYLPCQTPAHDRVAKKAFGLPQDGWDEPMDAAFARKWAEVIREWSARYGTNVAGWWFDGAYKHVRFSEEIAQIYAEAARAGNPGSIVAFNPGVALIRHTQAEDYTAGEINDPRKIKCEGRWVNGAQWHMLSYLGPSWCASPPRFKDADVVRMTGDIVRGGGVVTWDVPIQAGGLIPAPFVSQLTALRNGLAAGGAGKDAPPEETWIEPLKAGLAAFRETGEWALAGEAAKDPQNPARLTANEGAGIIYNGRNGRTADLLTRQEFGDVEAHVEFMIPDKSNSGVYFQGRYEIQVFDSFGNANPAHSDCGGIYERWKDNHGFEGRAPRVNASKPAGEWQTFDVVFRAPLFDAAGKKIANARFEKVVHNGQLVHENVEVTGPTRAARFGDEKPAGPFMLQGDHGPVAYRNIRIRPLPSAAPAPLFAMDTYTQRPYPRGTMPVAQQMDLLKELGYAGVAWTADDPARVKSARELAEARGLKMVAIYCHATLARDGLKRSDPIQGIIEALKGSGCVIWLHISSSDFASSSQQGDAVALAGLREIAGLAEQAGLTVAIYPHAGDWTERVQDAVRVADKVDRKNFGVTFNLCHCLKVGDGEKIPELLESAAPRLFIVTVNGADAGDPSLGWERLIQPVGRGSFDLRPVLRKLKSLNYKGPIACQGFGIPGDIRENLASTMAAWKSLAAQ